MADPKNAGISAEAQHVINSLEAHFGAVKRAVETGSDALVASVDKAWADVLAQLKTWGVEFAADTAPTTAASTAPADKAA